MFGLGKKTWIIGGVLIALVWNDRMGNKNAQSQP